jgi:hypothetical protein
MNGRSFLDGLRRGARPASLLLFLLAAGCGPSVGEVTGKVTYKGETLGSGVVLFQGDKETKNASIEPDGTYRITKVPAGKYLVTVETTPPPGGGASKGAREQQTMGVEGAPTPGKYVAIPDKYKDKTTSGLSCDVTGGKQNFDIPLQ